jgi:hypothetical protein
MSAFLLTILVLLDVVLLACFFFLNRRQEAHIELIEELSEERRLLSELRRSVQEELESAQVKSRESIGMVTRLAAEAEHEVKNGGATIAKEMEGVVSHLTEKFESPLKELTRRTGYLETVLRKVEVEKKVLKNLIARGEKVIRFFDDKVPYEQVLHEIEETKYSDARALLAKGIERDEIAKQLGMSVSEVKAVAGLT